MKLAIFDIDGVLADDHHRVQFAIDRQWYKYFNADLMADDDVWLQGKQMVENAVFLGYEIAYMTGRRDDRRQVTEDWLDDHGFPMGRVTMRTFSDQMVLALFKKKRLARVINGGKYSDVILFDDDPEVIRVCREEYGYESAVHCTWHIKEKALVKAAQA